MDRIIVIIGFYTDKNRTKYKELVYIIYRYKIEPYLCIDYIFVSQENQFYMALIFKEQHVTLFLVFLFLMFW